MSWASRLRTPLATKSRSYRSGAGFTIVETLIVLAIAGLILLMVFEAIPALERSSRNNSRRQDVTAILQALSHYELNHSANFPAQVTGPNGFMTASTRLSFYLTSQITLTAQVSPNIATHVGPVANTDEVDIYNYARCDQTNDGKASSTGAGYGDVVALYAIEAGAGGTANECQQL